MRTLTVTLEPIATSKRHSEFAATSTRIGWDEVDAV